MHRWSRRDFLKLAGLGAGVVACGGGVLAEVLFARPSRGATASLPIVRGLRHIPRLTAADPPPADDEYDLLFAPNPTSRDRVVGDFGLLRSHSTFQLPPTTMASYIDGFSWRNAVGANNTATSDAGIWPIDGVLPSDQFTIVFYIRSKGADYAYQPAATNSYHWFFDFDGSGVNGLYLVRKASTPSVMRLGWHFEPVRLEAVLSLLPGDIPADQWRRVVCVWDGVSLSLATGDNVRAGTSPPITSVVGSQWNGTLAEAVGLPASCCLLDGVSGGLYVNGGGASPANTGGPFEIEGPYVYRYQRSFTAAAAVKGRTIDVDPSAVLGIFPADIGGVLNQYAGFVQIGNAATDRDIHGRDAVIFRAAQAGLKTIRFPDLTSYMRFTYRPGSANFGVTDHDWTDFDSRVSLWKKRGITRFHADFLGTPAPLQPGPFPFHPTSAIRRLSTILPAPEATTRMSAGTAISIAEGAEGETVFLTSDHPGGAGNIKTSPTARAYSAAAVVDIGLPFGQSSGNVRLAPAIDNAAWGQVCADAIDRLINTHGITVVHLGFWNEPLSANLYCGNKTAYVAQWLAAARAIHTDGRLVSSGVKLGAGESSGWVSSETSADATETGWQKALVEQAATAGLPLPAISHHAYSGNLNMERRLINDQLAYLKANGFPDAKVRIGEWNLGMVAASQLEDLTTAASFHPDVWSDDYLAAFAHAFVCEAMAAGVDGMSFTRLQQLDIDRYPGAEQQLHLFSRDNPARAFGVSAYFQMLWKVSLGATRFSCSSNWPDIRAFGARSGSAPTTYTIVYGRYRPWRGQSDVGVEVDFQWNNLPSRFTWKQWLVDRTNVQEGTMKQVGGGDQGNLPGSVTLLPLSAACMQIVG